MPIEFGSDYNISNNDYYFSDPAPVYSPIQSFFSAPPLTSVYTPSYVPSLTVPTSSGGTGSSSFFDSAKQFVSGFAAQLPAITQAAVNVSQAYTSNGSRITPIVLPSGVVIAGEQQRGAYTPGYLQQVPSFLSNGNGAFQSNGGGALLPGASLLGGLSPVVLGAIGIGVVALLMYMRKK